MKAKLGVWAVELSLGLMVLAPASAAAPAKDKLVVVEAGALRLTWNRSGRITAVGCRGDDVSAAARASAGFALRDCAAQKAYEPLTGAVTVAADGLRFEGRNAAGTLAISASCVPRRDWMVVRGEVTNLTEADHAVSLRFALPVACEGWRWGTRLHKSEALIAGRRVHLGRPTPLGTGHMALRPVAAISDDRHTIGLVMPMDVIGLHDFSVDAERGMFSLAIDFAMTRHCPRYLKRVPFEFYVDGEADGWGLRSVLARSRR